MEYNVESNILSGEGTHNYLMKCYLSDETNMIAARIDFALD